MTRYVVAGVTGRVGRAVADELIARGARPAVIVRSEARGAEWSDRGAEVAIGSLDDRDFMARALEGAAGFFTLLPENVADDDFHAARRRMADAIAAGVAQAGVPHVALLSANGAALPDGNGPAKGLHYIENRLRESGATLSAMRACYFQDNVASAITPAREAGIYPNLLPSANARFPMIATADVGRLTAGQLLEPPARSEIVDLVGPVYSINEVADRLGAALGKDLQVVTIPAESHVTTLVQAGVPRGLAEAVAEMFAAFAAGRIVAPKGDRRLHGTTTIDEVIRACLGRHAARAQPS
jgi:uncharacterized protein YbjT (DUF2867 family)